MEISPQLSSLSVFLMVIPHSQMWTKPGFNSSVKPGRALRCCLQLGMPWPCTLVVLTTIWLQADQEHIQVPSHVNTSAWIKEQDCLVPVWTRLPPIPDAYVQLVTFACKSKCHTARCTCFRKDLKCTPAYGCDGIACCNPVGQ